MTIEVVTTDVAIKPEDFNPDTRNISNSEVTTYLACKRQYDFTFIENLAPKETAVPLDRGTVGHAAFERYILARLNGSNHEDSYKHGLTVFMDAVKLNPDRIALYMETQKIWERYMQVHQGWPEFELLGTEDRVDLQLTDSLRIAIRYDLKVRERTTGKVLIGDWKFTFDFWRDSDHYLNGQMPKYIAVLRLNNFQCDGGFVEQVRTRPLGPDKARDHRNLWRRNFYYPSAKKLKAMMNQHVATSMEIEKHRALDPEYRIEVASQPVLNKYGACKYCAFATLCNSMNEGVRDLQVEMRTSFAQNTYGYNEGQSIPGQSNESVDELL